MTLFEAAASGDVAATKAALTDAKDLNVLGEGRRTPLIEAANAGHLEVVKVLLEAGAEPDWRDDADETALLKAAANGHLAIARLLAPHANENDRALATSFLKTQGATHGPGVVFEEKGLKHKLIEAAARASNFVGDEQALQRFERNERAEENAKKKR